jgi:hypothetical protein
MITLIVDSPDSLHSNPIIDTIRLIKGLKKIAVTYCYKRKCDEVGILLGCRPLVLGRPAGERLPGLSGEG